MSRFQGDDGPDGWRLEVVRGRDPGRSYRVPEGAAETVLGAGVDEASGIDLRDQETSPTRRMAARQAALVRHGAGLEIRDLGPPGGTFVNLQRLLPGQSRALQPGDLIQLAAIQLRVVRSPARAPLPSPAAPAAPAELPAAFVLEGGQTCRRWDDFLTVAAQRWDGLRAELVSGRLAEHLRRIGRADLVPGPNEGQSDDERLDHWLARVPSTRPSGPELDVHPEQLEISAAHAAGTIRQTVRVTNVGYRRLRWSAHIEPGDAAWLRLAPEHDGRWCFTIETAVLPVLIEVPDRLDRPLNAAIVLESNGGTRGVAVRIVPTARTSPNGAEVGLGPGRSDWAAGLSSRVRSVRPAARVAWAALAAFGVRALMTIGAGGATPAAGPSLSAPALVLAAAGALIALVIGRRANRRQGPDEARGRDGVSFAFAGACLGLLGAAVVHAAVLSIEAPLRGAFGGGPLSPWTALPLWTAIGGALAVLSRGPLPYRAGASEADS